MKQEDEDIRGLDLRVEHFRLQLDNLINDAHLSAGTVLYILKDYVNGVQNVYNQSVNAQYQIFCEESKKEIAKKEKEQK